jgi:hypothetical protein
MSSDIIKISVAIEEEFLASIMQNAEHVDKAVLTYVEESHFKIDSYKWLVKTMKKRSWKPTVFEYLDQLLLEEIENDDKRMLYRAQLYNLFEKKLTFGADAYIKFKGYIAHHVVTRQIADAYEAYNRSKRVDLLVRDITEGGKQARCIISDTEYKIIDFAENYEQRQQKRIFDRDNPDLNPRVLVGIPEIDSLVQLKAPELFFLLAPTKRYKSIFLNTFAFSSLLQGFNVLHVPIETSVELTMSRYDAMVNAVNYSRIKEALLTSQEKELIDERMRWMASWESRLKVVKGQPETTTTDDIQNVIDRLQDLTGWSPDVVVFDYAQIMAPIERAKEDWRAQTKIVWDIKKFAEHNKVVCYSALQSNRTGIDGDNRLKVSNVGRTIGSTQAVDYQFSVDQNDKEREEGLIILRPMALRDAKNTDEDIVLNSDISKMLVDRINLLNMWKIAARVHKYEK